MSIALCFSAWVLDQIGRSFGVETWLLAAGLAKSLGQLFASHAILEGWASWICAGPLSPSGHAESGGGAPSMI